MSEIFGQFLKKQVFPGTKVLDEEYTERERNEERKKNKQRKERTNE